MSKHVFFSGHAKRGALNADVPYQIPLLARLTDINKAFERLRAANSVQA
jgi:hypothetical protein